MIEEPIRVYADTSVFGGVFDDEFSTPSRTFFEQVRQGRFELVVSALVRDELEDAPKTVRDYADAILTNAVEVHVVDDAVGLCDAYIAEQVVTGKSLHDAFHVALATVNDCSVVVSWNFRHIVHFDKILLYNKVNERNGYRPIAIYSPNEVIWYEDEDEDI